MPPRRCACACAVRNSPLDCYGDDDRSASGGFVRKLLPGWLYAPRRERLGRVAGAR